MKGGKVIAVNCCANNEMKVTRTYDKPYMSGWRMLFDSFFKIKKNDKKYDNITNIIISAMNLAAITHQDLMSKEADYLIEIETEKYGTLDFRFADEIIETGYEQAFKKLSETPFEL